MACQRPVSLGTHKFRTKREAERVARLLADRGHSVEWVRRNYGAQRELTWNVRLVDGSEIHNTQQLADMGIRFQRPASRKRFDGPPDYGVSVWFLRGRWTVNIAWTERGQRGSIGCGHGHKSHCAAVCCAEKWRRRIAEDCT